MFYMWQYFLEIGEVVMMKEKGIATLRTASIKRGLQENDCFLQSLKEVSVHNKCRKNYTDNKMISASIRRGNETVKEPTVKPSLRSLSEQPHFLKNICFLCGEEITEAFLNLQERLPISRKNYVHTVEKLDMKETLLIAAKERGDEWGLKIIQRLESVNDLVAADGRYHHLCHKNLYQVPAKTKKKRGYRPYTNVDEAMEKIF